MTTHFAKPRNRLPTRHLFLGNCGPAVGISEHSIKKALHDFDNLTITVPDPTQARTFVSFANADDAKRAAELLRSPHASLANRPLSIKFAALVEDESVSLAAGVLFAVLSQKF